MYIYTYIYIYVSMYVYMYVIYKTGKQKKNYTGSKQFVLRYNQSRIYF